MLGGDDGRTLVASVAPTYHEAQAAANYHAAILMTRSKCPTPDCPRGEEATHAPAHAPWESPETNSCWVRKQEVIHSLEPNCSRPQPTFRSSLG
jgi:hypothetical protein